MNVVSRVTALPWASIGMGATGLAGGYYASNTVTSNAFLHDMLSPPTQVLRRDPDMTVQRPRGDMGPLTGWAFMGGGAVMAGAGAALTTVRPGLRPVASLLTMGGAGLIGGGVAARMLYQNATIQRP